jgi:hypothetical protein
MYDENDQVDRQTPVPPAPVGIGEGYRATPCFLYVSGLRLILMDLLTASLFEQYWFYRNWRYLRDRDKLDISPFWRTWFNIFLIHELFRRMREDPQLEPAGRGPSPASWHATLWIVMTLASGVLSRIPTNNAPLFGGILGLSSFFCLLPAQRFVNRANAAQVPRPKTSPWTGWQYALLVVGIIINVVFFMAP